ncbi:MAG: hypothetical protein IPJ24_17995 [bacterium]|nr:hypothetical protein [bacterium]
MALQTLPEFTPGQPAGAVDAALRQALAVADQAHRCAVLWFAEVQRRELYRVLGHASLELRMPCTGSVFPAIASGSSGAWLTTWTACPRCAAKRWPTDASAGRSAQQVARVATSQTEAAWVERADAGGASSRRR